MKPRTIGIGKKEQNGDIEAQNGALKRMLEQLLKLRGSRDFESVETFEAWLWDVMQRANHTRSKRTSDELTVMRPLSVKKLPEYREETVPVSCWSMIRIKNNSYSVPSRLKGERVKVRVYDDRLEVFYADQYQLTVDRLLGEGRARVDYRHVIWSLVRKSGAFERYKYRDELFPSQVFRHAYDALVEGNDSLRKADIEYLRILHLAASTMECDVEAAVQLLLETNSLPSADAVKALVSPRATELPELTRPEVELSEYDSLLCEEVAQ